VDFPRRQRLAEIHSPLLSSVEDDQGLIKVFPSQQYSYTFPSNISKHLDDQYMKLTLPHVSKPNPRQLKSHAVFSLSLNSET